MLLATRCPFCETVFRLQPAQLAQRRGLVRCGHCQEVFDASSSLFDVSEGGDFSTAKPVAASAVEALAGAQQPSPDFSGQSLDPWAPAAGNAPAGAAIGHAAGSAVGSSGSTLDTRLRHHADSMQLTPLPLGSDYHSPPADIPSAPPPRPSEPKVPAGGFSAPFPPDQQEPTLADAPLEPFAYPSDEPDDDTLAAPPLAPPFVPPVVPPAPPAASAADTLVRPPVTPSPPPFSSAPAAPPPFAEETPREESPRVWHRAGRQEPSAFDEPELREPASLHGIPDNEPRFGSIGAGPGSFGAAAGAATGAAFGAAASGGAGAGAGAGAQARASTAAGAGGPRGPRPPGGGTAPPPSSGEPFSVRPVNDGSEPFPVTRETRPAEAGRTGWVAAGIVLAVLLLIALLAQLAWWQRESVQVAIPGSQAVYAKLCAHLGCQLTPPHDIDGLLVEPSDLRQIDGPHKLELRMPLRNRLNLALAYPAIELTLLDDQNNVAVRRVLWPQDYVPPGTVIAAGLPAHSTQTMIVHLDTGNAVASNFRVQIFYP
ncbi:hypothetical protein BTH42_20885 [Burkholderia sp. SRS-W-2-2016]|uniref:zinc-ribbon and DUF3426 domain-containing protein n=1 Tax=Burkholderia sp. SRS-W-2-2016 TaxID=1926878 RepID=UPI00094AF244|nr:zinc-ribbon and DUF3426 domain-containing protein [Burkholderia sp. SRS-W-2-2016]OLL29895.1 hypothetical protein BTH42_20885 [Burkholderia sp. SRS-W-2-2016]